MLLARPLERQGHRAQSIPLYTKLRTQSPDLHIVVCLWHFEGDPQKAAMRLKLTRGHGFFTTLPQVLQHIAFRAEKIASGAKQF